jgi:capsular exopolysaccharide synthesis family protein
MLLQALRRRRQVALVSGAAVAAVLGLWSIGERLFNPVYEGRFEMQIANPLELSPNGTPANTGSDGNGGVVEAIARSGTGPNLPNMVRLLGSPLVIAAVAETQAVPLDQLIERLRISLPEVGVNQVLAVSLRWPDPAKGEQILTALARRYVAFSQEQRQQALEAGMQFLDRQAPDLQARMDELQDQLRAFRVRHGFLDPLSQSQSLQQARDALTGDLRALQQSQAQLDSQALAIRTGRLVFPDAGNAAIEQQLGPTGLATPSRPERSNPADSSTPLAELQQLEKQLAAARATFHERTPLVRSLQARRAQLRPVVQRQALASVQAALLVNRAKQGELNRQILLLDQRFKASPERVKHYESLQQRLGVARDSYASYIRARETYRLEQARSSTPWAVIAPPRFGTRAVAPDLGQSLLRALLLGATAGVGAALLRERTDPLLHAPAQLQQSLDLPLLGVIPHLPEAIDALPAGEALALRESLRQLFIHLRDLQRTKGVRLLAVTSTAAREGRSTAVATLARTIAELGQRVLVVDADLRLGSQHRLLGLNSGGTAQGLADALDQDQSPLKTLIQPVAPQLDLLPAGRSPEDPARLLHSPSWQHRLEELRAMTQYSLILFDTPACEVLSDAALLGPGVDGLLFLVGLGQIERHRARQACRRLRRSGAAVLAVVANQVQPPSHLSEDG